MSFVFKAINLKKAFSRRVIFERISFSLEECQTLLVTGRNGAGKSTLLKILSDVLTSTEGSVTLTDNNVDISKDRNQFIGFVSPYLQMYDEFSAEENLELNRKIRGMVDRVNTEQLLLSLGLFHRRHDAVRTFSSGMKQRMKFALALAHQPRVLILDEPTSNLDEEGIQIVDGIMGLQRERGILIVATNDPNNVRNPTIRVDLNARS